MYKRIFCVFAIIIGLNTSLVFGKPANDVENHINMTSNADILPDKYIAYGVTTPVGKFPWMTYITIKYLAPGVTKICDGSLVSNLHVITAAHCVQSSLIEIKIYLGEYDLNTFPVDCLSNKCIKNTIVYVDKVISHDQYNDRTLNNDIALLKLQKRVPANIRPIPLLGLNVDNPLYNNAALVVAGWGGTEDALESYVLLASKVNLISKQRCSKMVDITVPEYHVCAGGPGFKNFCKGDSGGPLMYFYKGQYHLAGLVSFLAGDAKCGKSKVGFYTNVFHYIDWIKSNM